MNSEAKKKKKKHKKCKGCGSWVGHSVTSCPSCGSSCSHSESSTSDSGSSSGVADSGGGDGGMSATAWVKANCKFAAPNIHGPIPTTYYHHDQVKRPRDGYLPNPYGDFLPSGVQFNRQYGILSIETDLGTVELNLTPDQIEQFSQGFEKDIRNTFSEEHQQAQLANIAREMMAGKGVENETWSWSFDDYEGLAIYDRKTSQDIAVISIEELAKRGVPL